MCRHNAGYWQRREYLGFGLGASSLYRGMRFSNTRRMQEYLKESRNPDQIRKDVTVLSRNEQIEEFMFLGLRKSQGIGKSEFRKRFGVPIEEIYGDILQKQERQGLIRNGVEQISLTERGMDLSNYVFAQYL